MSAFHATGVRCAVAARRDDQGVKKARAVSGVTTPRGWAVRLRGRVSDRARARPESWWMLLTLGVLSVALGVGIILFPFAALHLAALVIGAWLVVVGATRLVATLVDREQPRDRQRLSAFVGVACVVAGLLAFRDVTGTLRVLAAIVALQWLIGGVVDIVKGVRSTAVERGWLIALGVLSCIAGLVFLVSPKLSLLAFSLLTAVSGVGIGVLDIAAGLRLRAMTRTRVAT
jgi:uncharacterized membrane protein HdeD (DUF308 family)